jgi:HlyD family secretion protein
MLKLPNAACHISIWVLFLLVTLLASSCLSSDKKTPDSFEAYTVRKIDFVNSLTVAGTLETSRSISKGCPVQGYDILINWLVDEGTMIAKGDTICKMSCADLETKYDAASNNADIARSALEKTKAQQALETSLLQSQIKTNKASTLIAMLDSAKLSFMSPSSRRIAELNMELALIEQKKLARRSENMKGINKLALRSLQTKVQIQEREMKRLHDYLDKLMMVSDTNGVVQHEIWWYTGKKLKAGDVIWNRTPILRLVDMSDFQVRLLVNENQFQSIQKDQKVEMSVDGYSNIKFTGKIIQKMPSGRPITENSKVKLFEIVASADSAPSSLKPGVNVTCKVILSMLKDTIAVPLMSVFEQDSLKVVYVRQKKTVAKRIITTSLLSDKYIVVTKGLKLNDQVLLTIPPDYLLK